MKKLYSIILLQFLVITGFAQKDFLPNLYHEAYRPQFHYTPDYNNLGNPIAVVKVDTTYQMYYQYNPHNLQEGFINWGLATSTNLQEWEQKNIVIEQPQNITDSMQSAPWAGAICQHNGKFYSWINRWNDGVYMSTGSDGISWDKEIKTTGTDKLKKGESFVTWYEPTQKWIMVAYNRETTTMYLLNSSDGIAWSELSHFNYNFGFPQFFELPVDQKSDDTRWVLATEKGTYVIGNFDGTTFNLESAVQQFNLSKKLKGSVFFKDDSTNDYYVISLLKDEQFPDLPEFGQFSFPLRVSLKQFSDGIKMIQEIPESIKELYVYKKNYEWENKKVYPGTGTNLLKKLKKSEYYIKATIENINSDQFGILVRTNDGNQGADINFNTKKSDFCFMNSRIDNFVLDNSKVELEVLIDRSSVEILMNNGEYVISYPYEPEITLLKYFLYTIGGEINVDYMEAHQLKSIWNKK